MSITSERIKQRRKQMGMTMDELAIKMGVKSQRTVVNWEKGNTEPSLSQLREMSRLSEIPMDFIFVPDKSN